MTDADPRGSTRDPVSRDHPDVLAVCRWLPQPYPWGAFTGRHDYIHVGDRQGRANLWWADFCVHRGDYVGPPRGGLVPDHYPDYDVAMPRRVSAGASGCLAEWADTSRRPGLRAEAKVSPPGIRSRQPVLAARLPAMTPTTSATHWRGCATTATPPDPTHRHQRRMLTPSPTASIPLGMPQTCSCHQSGPAPSRGMDVPSAVLRQAGAVAT